jgi:FdhE protein
VTAGFDARIARANELAERYPAASELLSFYRDLSAFQKSVFTNLHSTDLRGLIPLFPALHEIVRRSGPQTLADLGGGFDDPAELERVLNACWQGQTSDPAERFYGRVLLQPYAEWLASRGSGESNESGSTCPFCSARPVAAVLRGEGEGAKRSLLCSMCSTEWLFRRVLCPSCGEEDKEKLPVYTTPEIEHVRVEACETCKVFIKSIDLTRDGRAIPVVDEIATVTLSIWAEEHGYVKLEPNLLGV